MTTKVKVDPIVLEGQLVRFEPLTERHIDALLPVALDPRIWKFTRSAFASREDLAKYVRHALDLQRQGDGDSLRNGRAIVWQGRRQHEVRDRSQESLLGDRLELARSAVVALRDQSRGEVHHVTSRVRPLALCACRGQGHDAKPAISRGAPAALHNRGRRPSQTIHVRGGVIRDVASFSMLDAEWPAARRRIESILRWNP